MKTHALKPVTDGSPGSVVAQDSLGVCPARTGPGGPAATRVLSGAPLTPRRAPAAIPACPPRPDRRMRDVGTASDLTESGDT